MGFNEFLSSIFGNKATRDMKEIKPWVDKVKAAYPEIAALDNDALRAKTEELKAYIRNSAAEQRSKVEELKASVENTELEEREELFAQIDKLEKEILDIYEKALDEVLPAAFSIVKETAKRFSENEEITVTATEFDRHLAATKDFVRIEGDKAIYQNHWVAGGNDTVWNMVHYDVQLFGGVVLHKGKIAEMATGEGKTLVATLPVFLNALTGNGVHVVTVNDYLAKRDSEWMGPLYMFHGLSVDCIDKHQPNSDARRQAYLADITFGTNNEFGFDYLRDNMAISPNDLVQRKHNYAIVDEVDSVLIDDARTPLIISGPIPRGEEQLFEQFRPNVEVVVNAQKDLCSKMLIEAKKKMASSDQKEVEEGSIQLYRSFKGYPRNKALIKFLSEQGVKAQMLKTEEYFMSENMRHMHEATDELYFVIDEKNNSIELTDKGIDLLTGKTDDPTFFVLPDITSQLSELEHIQNEEEKQAKKDELLANYSVKSERVHTINQLLKAYTLFEKDDEYVVMDNKVMIVDEQTGRIMDGRRYSDGLHQAIEAKEGVEIARESKTIATITYQNYFRLYGKLSGMTGTALTEEDEFREIYKLDVIEIPTNKPVIRIDHPDVVFKTEKGKFNAVIEQVIECHKKGQPVLVGTVSVEKSEYLSRLLKNKGIKHEVLNAKHHDREAMIVAQAGKYGAVTIATNMAGRGTDIMLGGNAEYKSLADLQKMGYSEEVAVEAAGFSNTQDEEVLAARAEYKKLYAKYSEEVKELAEKVREAGGLYIIGTERHESRRIDNQLRGRSGRQGDPGESTFFLSLEDDLMRIFGGERITAMMDTLKVDENTPIQSKMLTGVIESSQKKIEGRNFNIRKNVLNYDDVMNTQREIIYKQRQQVLDGEDLHENILGMIKEFVEDSVNMYITDEDVQDNWNLQGLKDRLMGIITVEDDFNYTPQELDEITKKDIVDLLEDRALKIYAKREEDLGQELLHEIERVVLLKVVDTKWMAHIDDMDELKKGIGLRSYGQKNPVVEYRMEGMDMFDDMVASIREDTVRMLFTIQVRKNSAAPKREDVLKPGEHHNMTVRKAKKPGRNDLCPCGSGKKYKNCCGAGNGVQADEAEQAENSSDSSEK